LDFFLEKDKEKKGKAGVLKLDLFPREEVLLGNMVECNEHVISQPTNLYTRRGPGKHDERS
jgi:hypothetical protein